MKTDPTATNVFWFSNSTFVGAYNFGGFVLKENKVAYINQGAGQNLTWGSQSININNITGAEVLVAFFDKNTGTCTGLDFIQGNDGHSDRGTSLAIDANGDVLVGGEFEHTLYDANGGSVMNPVPSNPDFFIAKYATEPCPPLGVETSEKTSLKIWPNPVKEKLKVSVETETAYVLYDMLGRMVVKGMVNPNQNLIDVKNLSPGLYLLKLGNGEKKTTVKVIKQ